MFPRDEDNFHYRKNIKIIGGVDLNEEKFISEYRKKFINRYPEYVRGNEPFYLTALAHRQYKKYLEIVHK
jgi:hypothetical protein